MAERQRVSLIFSLLFSFAAVGLLASEADWLVLQAEGEVLWLTILIVTCCLPGLLAWAAGRLDPLEPVYAVAAATLVYFGVMVGVLLQTDSFRMLSIDYREEVPEVLFLAWLALVGFYIAYYGGGRAPGRLGPREAMDDATRVRAHRYALGLLFVAGFLLVLWVVIGRVPLWSLWVFGEASYGSWVSEGTGVRLGYLYAAQEALPACVLLLTATRRVRRWPLTSYLLLAAVTILFAGLGVRARVLLIMGSAAAFYYLERDRRPSVWQLAVMGFVVLYAIAGALGYYRGPGRVFGQGSVSLETAWHEFVEGSGIAVTAAAYVRWVPKLGYDWGKSFLSLLVTPIPSALWPEKYLFLGKPAIDEFIAYGAAAPFFTIFYASYGPAGVVLGMGLAGWACRGVYESYRANRHDVFAQISLALLWAYLFHAYGRHSITLIAYSVVYVFGPVYVVRKLIDRFRRGEICDARSAGRAVPQA